MDQSGEIWKGSKREIFRLQLLSFYADDTNIPEFMQFMDNKPVRYDNIPGVREWDNGIQNKKLSGVDIINLHVTGLPLDNGLRFGIGFLRAHERYGMRSLFVERKEVSSIIYGFKDFWMLDSKIVIPVVYDHSNLWVEEGKPITTSEEVRKYAALKERLLKVAVPMEDFLRVNKVDLVPDSKKRRIKC